MSAGPSAVSFTSTKVTPPKIAVPNTSAPPSADSDMPFVNTGWSSLTDKRAIASRPSYVCANKMTSGFSAPARAAMPAAAT